MADIVLDLNDQRPVWALPDFVGADILAAAPAGWTLARMSAPAVGTGDGKSGAAPEVLEAVRDATVYLGYGISAEVLRAGPKLRWVHSASAGIGTSLTPELLARDVVLTNSAGIHGPPMAEAVLGMMLHFARGFDLAVRAQAEGRWDADRFYRGDIAFPEIAGSCVGIVGLGGIGQEVAWRARALGARVLGLKRRPGASPEGIEVMTGEPGLRRLLQESDTLVITAPDTPATRGLIDAAALAQMKPSAVLINVSRGRIVDEDALAAALRTGRLRGAGLDVFTVEPLPAEHALWTLPNVLLTPHVSPITPHFWRRQTDLIVDNLRRFARGETMRNIVDKREGY
jgi:phosphoglycerate dehydrogenase-like enzyme